MASTKTNKSLEADRGFRPQLNQKLYVYYSQSSKILDLSLNYTDLGPGGDSLEGSHSCKNLSPGLRALEMASSMNVVVHCVRLVD